MAKIRLNKLPDGFEVKNGKVVKKLQQGGMTTGDQSNFGLVTNPYNSQSIGMNESNDIDVRYSLSSVPREIANLEAEGGETVLTDLNNDGQFGLYNITGPRHSQGGVPMYLPEQSFVFSDTKAMKFNKNELAEFGIESRKGMTPADVSKKFQLNEYLGSMADPFADNIQAKSAELMLDKNLMNLSKVAFGQEQKKQFRDGVPLASHPYLVSMGIDPIQFTQKVENITAQQAAQNMFEQMTPEQQAQVMALKQMMADSGQPQAKYGLEKYQNKGETNSFTFFNSPPVSNDLISNDFPLFEAARLKNQDFFNQDLNYNNVPDYLEVPSTNQSDPSDQPAVTSEEETDASRNNNNTANTDEPVAKSKPRSKSRKQSNVAYDPAVTEYYNKLGVDINTSGILAQKYADMQGYIKGTGFFGGGKENYQGFLESWKDIYPDFDKLKDAIDNQTTYLKDGTPEVREFQKWLNDVYIPQEVESIGKKATEAGQEWTDQMAENLTNRLQSDYGFGDNKGKGKTYDGDFGTYTSSRRPIGFEPIIPEEKEKEKEIEIKDPEYKYIPPSYDFFTQDMLKLGALGMRDRSMYLPWQPAVEIPRVDYVLEEPTRQLADANEQFNILSQALGAFSGPQSMNARVSKAQGDLFKNNAQVFAQVHGRNINTINKGNTINSQLEAGAKREARDRNVKLLDDTNLTLQNYEDEKNVDREQFADLMANAYTNAANAYNLSSIYDQYNIDPVSGGGIYFTNPRSIYGSKPGQQPMSREEIINLAKELDNQGLDVSGDKVMEKLMGQTASTDPRQQYFNSMQNNYAGTGYTAKTGKELKKYAVLPFYLGKTSM